MKTFLFLLWTALVVWGYLALSGNIVQDEVHVGPDLVFSVANSRDLEVSSEGKTTIEATSPYYFLLWQSSEEVIAGLPSIEWDRGTHYSVEPTEIKNGRWMLESEGTVKVRLVSSASITARAIETDPASTYILMLLPAGIAWMAGLVFGSDLVND